MSPTKRLHLELSLTALTPVSPTDPASVVVDGDSHGLAVVIGQNICVPTTIHVGLANTSGGNLGIKEQPKQ